MSEPSELQPLLPPPLLVVLLVLPLDPPLPLLVLLVLGNPHSLILQRVSTQSSNARIWALGASHIGELVPSNTQKRQ